jgi:hypothetical protein
MGCKLKYGLVIYNILKIYIRIICGKWYVGAVLHDFH